MTDTQSLEDIRTLLLAYPGVNSAVVFRVPNCDEVHMRFRCNDAESLRSIAAASVWANVEITLGDPNCRICAEPEGVLDLPCDIEIPDNHSEIPTESQLFGVYISADLADQGLITEDRLTQLHTGWNTQLAYRKPKPPQSTE